MYTLGAAGNAAIFFFSGVGAVIVGLWVLSYAAHSFLVVLESTAAGQDEVRWPDEPMFDWLWKLWYLAWLVGFWLVPVWFLLDGVFTRLLGLPAVGVYPLLVIVIWLLFPVSLFSSLSANVRWAVLRPAILRQLFRQGHVMVVVWLIAGGLVVGAGVLGYLALRLETWLLLPVAGLAGATVLLLYARLLGRVAWLLADQPRKRRKKKKRVAAEVPGGDPAPIPQRVEPLSNLPPLPLEGVTLTPEAVKVVPQPIPVREDEWAPATPYGVQDDPPAVRPAPPSFPRPTPEADAYGVREEEPAAPVPLAVDGHRPIGVEVSMPTGPGRPLSPGEEPPAPAPLEMRFLESTTPPPPARPLLSGVYTFPWYPASLHAWIYLSLTGCVFGALMRVMLLTWPFD